MGIINKMLQNISTYQTQPGHLTLTQSVPTEFYIIQTA